MHAGMTRALALLCIASACGGADARRAETLNVDDPTAKVAPDSAKAAAPKSVARHVDTPAIVGGQQGGLDTSKIVVTLHPVVRTNTPADLVVTAPDGRRTGVDPVSFAKLTEIDRARYDSIEPPDVREDTPSYSLIRQFYLGHPPTGRWRITVVGRRDGPFTLQVRIVPRTGPPRVAKFDGLKATKGARLEFEFDYPPADTGAVVVRRP
jgi:hypothetical protein